MTTSLLHWIGFTALTVKCLFNDPSNAIKWTNNCLSPGLQEFRYIPRFVQWINLFSLTFRASLTKLGIPRRGSAIKCNPQALPMETFTPAASFFICCADVGKSFQQQQRKSPWRGSGSQSCQYTRTRTHNESRQTQTPLRSQTKSPSQSTSHTCYPSSRGRHFFLLVDTRFWH